MDLNVSDVFAQKNIFVSGGTGFMGKVLIEKLLRSCPNINKIYVLTRRKKGVDTMDRWTAISKIPLFEKLHSIYPNAFADKIVPIEGDVTDLNLGLSEADRELLANEVHIVYHVAATVRFDEPLQKALLINTRGAREMCEFALTMKRIQIFVHVSTAYAHTQSNTIEEKLYAPSANWRQFIQLAEEGDQHQLQIMMGLLMQDYPNTYTFTKALAENVVHDLLNGRMANLILRPAIVVVTMDDPIQGWVDNFYGPIGLFAAGGTGLIRHLYVPENVRLDGIPVDAAIKIFIYSVWYKLTKCTLPRKLETEAINCTIMEQHKRTNIEFCNYMLKDLTKLSLNLTVWYPMPNPTTCYYKYYIYFMLFQLIPSFFLDFLLMLLRYPPAVFRLQRKIFITTNALQYFAWNEFHVVNKKMFEMEDLLCEGDRNAFAMNMETWDVPELTKKCVYGAKHYLLKETEMNPTLKALHINTLIVLHYLTNIAFYYYVGYFLFYYAPDIILALYNQF